MATNIALSNRLFQHNYIQFTFEEFKETAKYWLDKNTLEIHSIVDITLETKQTKVWVTLLLSDATEINLRLPGHSSFGASTIIAISENPSSALPIYRNVANITTDIQQHSITLKEQRDKYEISLKNKEQELLEFTEKYLNFTTTNAEHLI